MSHADPVPPPPPTQVLALSAGYLATVGGLLLVIIVVLAALWMRERNRRTNAERQVHQLTEQNDQTRRSLMQFMLGSMDRQATAVRPFQPEDHTHVAVTLDGVRRKAYFLPAGGAARFGFQPGDVIVIEESSQAPATSSAPADASPPTGQ